MDFNIGLVWQIEKRGYKISVWLNALQHFSHPSEDWPSVLQYGHVPVTYLSGKYLLSVSQ